MLISIQENYDEICESLSKEATKRHTNYHLHKQQFRKSVSNPYLGILKPDAPSQISMTQS